MKRIKKALLIFGIIAVLISVGFFAYPTVNNLIFVQEQQNVIDQYVNEIEAIKPAEAKSKKNKGTKNKPINTSYAKLKKAVKNYNEQIYTDRQIGLSVEKAYQVPCLDLAEYGLSNNIYGYIEIPDIDVKMSILLGANDYNMSLGATHMSHTSIPFGGKNTNSVIAAHCGYAGKHMFRYISELSPGAEVKITTPFDTLTYRVAETKIIDPNDAESLVIQDGKDMVTLLTCHPYPTNKYRCAVYCERSEK